MIKLYQNKEWLYQKYIVEKLNLSEISKLCNKNHVTIWIWMKKFNIPRRPISCGFYGKHHTKEAKEKMRITNSGSKNGNWKGGNIPSRMRLREKYKNNPLLSKEELGKEINEKEVIHHIDMNKNNNNPNNLYIYKNHSEHFKGHWSLNKIIVDLLKNENIKFFEGKYYLI